MKTCLPCILLSIAFNLPARAAAAERCPVELNQPTPTGWLCGPHAHASRGASWARHKIPGGWREHGTQVSVFPVLNCLPIFK